MSEQHAAALGWAVSHAPTIAAYERHARESIAPVLERFVRYIEENITGRPGDVDEGEAA